jgi:hypothetical protein
VVGISLSAMSSYHALYRYIVILCTDVDLSCHLKFDGNHELAFIHLFFYLIEINICVYHNRVLQCYKLVIHRYSEMFLSSLATANRLFDRTSKVAHPETWWDPYVELRGVCSVSAGHLTRLKCSGVLGARSFK